jgi:hypothetical protein
MENVTTDDQLIVPTGQEHLPKNKAKPLPNLSIKLHDNVIELGILYRYQDQLELFKNIFRESHRRDKEELVQILQNLNPNYETLLYSRGREKKPILHRKYVSARMDSQLIERVIKESENLRRGGRQISYNQSIYAPPRRPELYLTRISVPLLDRDYRNALNVIKPLFKLTIGIKTQREIISESLSKPRIKRNMYREFIEVLNEARRRDLISAERRREINQMWRDNEDMREELLEELRILIAPV